ncbi:MAG: hypothetical protein ACE3JU_11495 [Paenibacillus sp.]|uniref:hypothetical protein n=1 Tax=Paenibacillus sp. TaxID=58172 RepID=UPI003B7A7A22
MSEVTLMISCLPFMLRNMDANLELFRPCVLDAFNVMYGDPTDEQPRYNTHTLKARLELAFSAVAYANKLVFSQDIFKSEIKNPYDEIDAAIHLARTEFNFIAHPLTFVDELSDRDHYQQYLNDQAESKKKKRKKKTAAQPLPSEEEGQNSRADAKNHTERWKYKRTTRSANNTKEFVEKVYHILAFVYQTRQANTCCL